MIIWEVILRLTSEPLDATSSVAVSSSAKTSLQDSTKPSFHRPLFRSVNRSGSTLCSSSVRDVKIAAIEPSFFAARVEVAVAVIIDLRKYLAICCELKVLPQTIMMDGVKSWGEQHEDVSLFCSYVGMLRYVLVTRAIHFRLGQMIAEENLPWR